MSQDGRVVGPYSPAVGYTVYLQRFESGDPTAVEPTRAHAVLTRHGDITKGEFGTRLRRRDEPLGRELISLAYDEDGRLSGVAVDRPTGDGLAAFLWACMSELGMVAMFPDDPVLVIGPEGYRAHLPDYFPEDSDFRVARSEQEAWPAEPW